MNKDEIFKVASDGYYLNPEMIKFLLVENLALKTMLHDKGLITPEEFSERKERAASMLEEKAKSQIMLHFKKLLDGQN
jgi:hypothetical protein